MLYACGGDNRQACQLLRQLHLQGYRQKKTNDRVKAEGNYKGIRQIRPSCVNHAMGEVEELDGPVDHGKAKCDKHVDATRNNAV